MHDQFRRITGPLHQVARHPLEVDPADRHGQALALVVNGDRSLWIAAQFSLGLFALLGQHHQRFRIGTRIVVVLAVELLGDVVDHSSGPVDPAQHHVPVSGQHAEVRRCVAHDRDVERPSAQVVHHDGTFFGHPVGASQLPLLPGIGQRRSCRLVDDVNDVQARDLAGILGRLTSHIVEVVRNGDDRVDDWTDPGFGVLLQLFQDEGRDELGRQLLPLIDDKEVFVAHLAFDRLDDVLGVLDRHPLGAGTDDHLAIVTQQHHRRSNRATVCVENRERLATGVQLGDGGESRSQIDTDSVPRKNIHVVQP